MKTVDYYVKQSYPYMAFAKKNEVRYDDVLIASDWMEKAVPYFMEDHVKVVFDRLGAAMVLRIKVLTQCMRDRNERNLS